MAENDLAPIRVDVLKAEAPAYIELFEVDCTILGVATGLDLYRFTNSEVTVNWGGNAYLPFPLEITGIESASDSAPARPILRIANLTGLNGNFIKLFGTLAFTYDDLVGVSVVYIRTFEPYLNTAQRISAPPLKYYIRKKTAHNRLELSFELGSPLDKERAFLPKRQMLRRDFPGLSINKYFG